MKKLILLFAFIASGMIATAQSTPVARNLGDPAARAKTQTEKIAGIVKDITPAQKSQIEVICLNKVNAMDNLKMKTNAKAGDPVYDAEHKKIHDKFIADLKTVLSADQVKLAQAELDKQKK